MAKLTQEQKGFLNMAGEFLVAAELNRRQVLSAVTYGTSKSADVWAFDARSHRAVRIEVKTTGPKSKAWVIGNRAILEENWRNDLIWVLVRLPEPISTGPPCDDAMRGRHAPQFFIFTSQELGTIVGARDQWYRQRFLEQHGREFTGVGVPKMFLEEAMPYENCWDTILASVL
jgi:hypothetical protein